MCKKNYKYPICENRTLCDLDKDWTWGIRIFIGYCCLVLLIGAGYVIMHCLIPADSKVPTALVTSLTRAENLVSGTTLEVRDSTLPGVDKLPSNLLSEESTQIVAAYQTLLKTQAAAAQKAQIDQALKELRVEAENTTSIDQTRVLRLIDRAENETNQSEYDAAVIGVYLDSIREEISSTGRIYFWSTGILKWVELLFWSLIGTCFYALWQIQHWLRASPVGDFHKHLWWYLSMTIRGPFVSILLIFAFSTLSLDVVNLNLDLKTMPMQVWIFVAGILGIFSYTAYEQLCLIIRKLFSKAASLAEEQQGINPTEAAIPLGGSRLFTSDDKNVIWDIVPSDIGSIDINGKYTAPAGTEKAISSGTQVYIRATHKTEPSISSTARATLFAPFRVEEEVPYKDKKVKFKVEPATEQAICWRVEPAELAQIDTEGNLTFKPPVEKGTKLTIKAALKEIPAACSILVWELPETISDENKTASSNDK